MVNYEALIDFIDGHRLTPFAWGRHDCVTFAAGAVKAATGIPILKSIKSRWRSQRAALALIDSYGGLASAVDSLLSPISPAMARRGDVAAITLENGGHRLMVVEGDYLVGPGPEGLIRQPRSEAVLAWSVHALISD